MQTDTDVFSVFVCMQYPTARKEKTLFKAEKIKDRREGKLILDKVSVRHIFL